jgi:hypothetical protein
MRHFLSLVLGIILAPAIWGAVAFGINRTAKAQTVLASATDRDRLVGAGLLIAAGLALGILLGTRLSPVGPALAGLVFLAASGMALDPKSPIFDWDVPRLSQADHTTLLVPLQVGLLWALGVALLIPILVPSRWRKSVAAAAVTPPGAPNVPPGPYPGPRQSGAPGWSATTAQGAPDQGTPGSPATTPSSGADQTRQYTPSTGYESSQEQGYAYPAYGSGYQQPTYGGGTGYQSTYAEPSSGGHQQPPPPTYQSGSPSSYSPTTYGRSRAEDETPTAETATGPSAEPDAGDPPVERSDATRRVLRPAPPPSWSGGDDQENRPRP